MIGMQQKYIKYTVNLLTIISKPSLISENQASFRRIQNTNAKYFC